MDNTDQKKLFSEFPAVTTEEWEAKIQTDLKGADYEKKLIWQTAEGFPVRPYYRSEDLAGLEYLNTLPDEYPYVRGIDAKRNDWLVRQDIMTKDIREANRLALDAIARGADSLGFDATEVTTHKEINQLLANIDLSGIDINFFASRSYPLTLELFIYEISHRASDTELINGSLNFDPLGYLLLHGDFYMNWMHNLEEAEYLLNTVQKRLPHLKVLTINGHYFQDAGSTLVQELAFSLAAANEYLAGLTDKGLSVDMLSPRIMFSFSTGANYFMEIAKLRAARLLWASIVNAYHPVSKESSKAFIHSNTAFWNKTLYDPYVNMLRTTTEGMSAAIGNADSITIHPFDAVFQDPDDFSTRIARNQQLILKEESYLNKIVDPAAGSYYLENLTDSIAHHAWTLFREIEEKGGMLACIKAGFIQDEINHSRQQKEMDIAQRKMVVIGTNQYPNLLEVMKDKQKLQAGEIHEKETTYKKLKPFRGSEPFEKIRLATENYVAKGNKKPAVFLFTMGNLSMLRARAGFATNFFGCAGFDIIDNPGFQSIHEGLDEALSSNAEIVVICSSDEEYAQIVPEICTRLKTARPSLMVLVAGYPKEMIDTFKASGIDDFIHVRSNLLAALQAYQQKLGML